MHVMGRLMAVVLVGLGAAVLVRTFAEVGVERLALGHVVGPGLVLAGVARLRLQAMLDDRRAIARAARPAGYDVVDVPRGTGAEAARAAGIDGAAEGSPRGNST